MNIILEVTGTAACALVVVRYSYRAITGVSFGHLLSEGMKAMMNTPQHLKNCIAWNIGERDRYRGIYNNATTPVSRNNAMREVRRHQRNIDNLNETQRQLDASN